MKKTYLALAVASAALITLPAVAQDYQMEAGLSYVSYDNDGNSDSAIGVDFRYNFETVSTANRPLSEAGFLGRNGGVNVGLSQVDKADYNVLDLGANYWFEDIYAAIDYSQIDGDGKYTLTGGYMLNDGLRVHASFTDGDAVAESIIGIGAKYVASLGSNFVNLEGSFETSDGENAINLAGDYFLNNALSVGAGITTYSASGAKTAIDIGAKYFVMPNVSGELSYTLNSDGMDKFNVIGLRVAARF